MGPANVPGLGCVWNLAATRRQVPQKVRCTTSSGRGEAA